MAENNETL